jgi:hypothetical protein
MPLVIICGRPCVGKSSFARLLSDACVAGGATNVCLVVEEESGGGSSFGGDRINSYADASAEKVTRARVRAGVERALTEASAVVIADGGHGVKGFRYELFCAARNVGARSTVVWVGPDVPYSVASAVNAVRCNDVNHVIEGNGRATSYTAITLDDLWARFEPPDSRNRWDSPLVRVPLVCKAARAGNTSLATAAQRGQLSNVPITLILSNGLSWWEAVALTVNNSNNNNNNNTGDNDDDTNPRSGPYLTSRFDLGRVISANDLARERGTGAVVEASLGAARRAARRVADANAGYCEMPIRDLVTAAATTQRYGAVPLHGFSSRVGVSRNTAPNYFAEDFNADIDSDAEDNDDIANIADFEDLNDDIIIPENDNKPISLPSTIVPSTSLPSSITATSSLVKSSFKRATLVSSGTITSKTITGTASLVNNTSTMTEEEKSSSDSIDNDFGDSIGDAIHWLVAFCLGVNTAITNNTTSSSSNIESVTKSALLAVAEADALRMNDKNNQNEQDRHIAAEANSAALVAALIDVDLSAIGAVVVSVDGVGLIRLRLSRATTGQEIARIRRTFLAPGSDMGDGSATSFAHFISKELKKNRT